MEGEGGPAPAISAGAPQPAAGLPRPTTSLPPFDSSRAVGDASAAAARPPPPPMGVAAPAAVIAPAGDVALTTREINIIFVGLMLSMFLAALDQSVVRARAWRIDMGLLRGF
jgi:hypothetical protein